MTNEEAIKWLNVERQLIVEVPQDNSKELKEAYDMAIQALEKNIEKEPVQTHTMWIPVSERLPKERNHYLINVKIDGMNGCKPYYEIQTSWYSDGQFVVDYISDGLVARRSVIAWMPLPEEPYKAESEDEEGMKCRNT